MQASLAQSKIRTDAEDDISASSVSEQKNEQRIQIQTTMLIPSQVVQRLVSSSQRMEKYMYWKHLSQNEDSNVLTDTTEDDDSSTDDGEHTDNDDSAKTGVSRLLIPSQVVQRFMSNRQRNEEYEVDDNDDNTYDDNAYNSADVSTTDDDDSEHTDIATTSPSLIPPLILSNTRAISTNGFFNVDNNDNTDNDDNTYDDNAYNSADVSITDDDGEHKDGEHSENEQENIHPHVNLNDYAQWRQIRLQNLPKDAAPAFDGGSCSCSNCYLQSKKKIKCDGCLKKLTLKYFDLMYSVRYHGRFLNFKKNFQTLHESSLKILCNDCHGVEYLDNELWKSNDRLKCFQQCGACDYCHLPCVLTKEHMLPKSNGGLNNVANYSYICT